jgi:hypothetical protein
MSNIICMYNYSKDWMKAHNYRMASKCCYGCAYFLYTENLQGHCIKVNDFVQHDHECDIYDPKVKEEVLN